MKLVFYIAALAMVALAMAAIIVPLLLRARQLGRPRGILALALLVAVALPLATLAVYRTVGAPAMLDGVTAQPSATMQQALAELRKHLTQEPSDLRGWLLLARTDNAIRQPAEARDAYQHILNLDPNHIEAMVGWADMDSTLQQDHVVSAHARALLLRAVATEPNNQHGLWLLGISQFQQNRFADAAATWRRLLPLLEPASEIANTVREQIAAADERAGSAPADMPVVDTSADSASAATAPKSPAIPVQVSLAPALKAQLKAGDTLFVYARAPDGPPMPLAVARMDARALPVKVILTDAMAMTPSLKLSSVAQVLIGARISHSGQAIAQSGDLEGSAGVIAVSRADPVNIVIEKVH